MNNPPRTVSDTKRAFYSLHTRPINSIYRRVVEELMVEMHLLSVNVDFRYDPLFALGVVTSFDRFMEGYIPEQDKASIFNSLCRALEQEPEKYRHDAQRCQELAENLSKEEVINWLSQTQIPPNAGELQQQLEGIIHNQRFKYNRLFAIGLLTLLEQTSPNFLKDDSNSTQIIEKICTTLNLPADKIQKDLELYKSNLEKMAQARIVLEDVLQAERKKREQRNQEKNTPTTQSS